MRKAAWSWQHYVLLRMTRLWTVLLPALLLTFALDSLGHYLSTPDSIQNELPEISGAMDTAAFMGNLLFVQTIFVQTFEAPMGRCGALRTSFGIMSCLRSLPLRSYPIPSWGD